MARRRLLHPLPIGLMAALAGSAAPALASVPDHYGFSSRSAAMAGAVAGDAADFSAGYYNPAGLAEAPGVELAFGYTHYVQHLQVNGLDNEVDDVHGLQAGVVAPGVLFGVPFAFSVGVHLPDDGLSFIKARRQGVPRWELYDARSQLLYLEVGLAVRPFDWLEVGGGLAYLSATRGSFAIRGRANILSPFDSELEHEVDADLTAVRFPQAGLRLLLEDWGALGVVYRGESSLDLQLDADLRGVVEWAGIDVPLLYQLEAHTVAAFTPHQVAVGISFQRIDDLHLNFDVTWMNWSGYISPTAKLKALLEVEPPEGIPIELPDEPAPTQFIPPNFEDRFVPRVGVEYVAGSFGSSRKVHGEDRALVQLPVRLGYAYEPSPVPDQTGVTNLIDADRHTLTVGTGVTLNGLIEELPGAIHLDLHGAFSLLPERIVHKDNPADFIGDYSASGSMYGGGGTLKVVF
ncbi:MAG: outer membrane protein transport protein [Deltaproteobacteria bacterium]|nr:outer membrane protein transport protein [Deltaproteobacteria bacterium]